MEYRRATSEEQALGWLAERGDSARVIAGGTDVMLQYARGEIGPAAFVHIENVRSLAAVGQGATVTRLGSLVTHRRMAADSLIRTRHPALSAAAATVGGWQTQAVGTLGGNICNASPAADTAAPLLVADAVVELKSTQGTRRVPLAEFFVGRRTTGKRPDELVVAVEAEPLDRHGAEVYLKAGRRGAMVVAVVGLAVRLTFGEHGQVRDARVALCSVGPTPVRALLAEQVLAEGGASDDAVRAAGEELLGEVSPVGDARASATYRRMVLVGLLDRAVACCRSQIEAKRGAARDH